MISEEFLIQYPVLGLIGQILMIVFYLAILWVFGRMGDNVNKIRKMMEQELKTRQGS